MKNYLFGLRPRPKKLQWETIVCFYKDCKNRRSSLKRIFYLLIQNITDSSKILLIPNLLHNLADSMARWYIKGMRKRKKHIHFIGICGVTMAPLAVLYKKMDWKVTGSDKGFFPPMSTYLEKNGIQIMPGFKPEHLKPRPDLVVVMAFITKKNPELSSAIEQGIAFKPYGEVLPGLIEKENSIVVAGDHGKTSIASLAAWVLETAGFCPNFMIGGIPKNFGEGIRKTNSYWSVIEGDEYPVASWRKTPRFLCYDPKYLILPDVRWDHMDQYPTYREYLRGFIKLARKVPRNGVIFANNSSRALKKIVRGAKAKVVWYEGGGPPWQENTAAVYALAKELGIDESTISRALKTFKGVKRRQEVRFRNSKVVVVDDIAHTPVKVRGALDILRKQFPGYYISIVYEPGNRSVAALRQRDYLTCFKGAHQIILPRLSSFSNKARDFNRRLAKKIAPHYQRPVLYLDNDQEIVEKIMGKIKSTNKKNLVLFASQKGFRGMIEVIISLLQQPPSGARRFRQRR